MEGTRIDGNDQIDIGYRIDKTFDSCACCQIDQMIDTGFLGILGVFDVVVFVPDKQEVVALPIQQPEELNRIFIGYFRNSLFSPPKYKAMVLCELSN